MTPIKIRWNIHTEVRILSQSIIQINGTIKLFDTSNAIGNKALFLFIGAKVDLTFKGRFVLLLGREVKLWLLLKINVLTSPTRTKVISIMPLLPSEFERMNQQQPSFDVLLLLKQRRSQLEMHTQNMIWSVLHSPALAFPKIRNTTPLYSYTVLKEIMARCLSPSKMLKNASFPWMNNLLVTKLLQKLH